jgi:hypothetical protein
MLLVGTNKVMLNRDEAAAAENRKLIKVILQWMEERREEERRWLTAISLNRAACFGHSFMLYSNAIN